MKRLMILVLVAFCATLGSINAQAAENNSLKGTWEYKVSEAPYEYSSGKLIFAEREGKTSGVVKLMNGTEIKIQSLKVENDSFSFVVEIEYNNVTVTGKVAAGKITGKADTPDGEMNISAVRPKI